jgi:hypothetical protein
MHQEALHDCLARLIPHVDAARIALTGGVAMGVYEHARLLAAEDIDFVAEDAGVVRSTVTSDFLVSHFHLPQHDSPKFMIQLVDPPTRLRLDFFPDARGTLRRASLHVVAGVPLRVLQANDILDHKLALVSNASHASPVDAKHYSDAMLLGTLCGRDVPALDASQLASAVYSQDLDASCIRCQVSQHADFPLASKRAILDVLGYV